MSPKEGKLRRRELGDILRSDAMYRNQTRPIRSLTRKTDGFGSKPGDLIDEEGELLIRPCSVAEATLYQEMIESHPLLADLVPVYMGTLSLQGLPAFDQALSKAQEVDTQTQTTAIEQRTGKLEHQNALVLYNLAYGYSHPNICYIRLGRQLCSDRAPLSKRQRFAKFVAETTHEELGFAITSMRVYKGDYEHIDWDADSYQNFTRDWARHQVKAENVVDWLRRFIFNRSAGIDAELGKALANAFLRDLENMRTVLEKEEWRCYSASIAIIFEGDGPTLRDAVEAMTKVRDKFEVMTEADRRYYGPVIDKNRKDDPDLGKHYCYLGGDEDEDVDLNMDLDLDEDEDEQRPTYTLRLLDFSEASWEPGSGPDENLLFGVRRLIEIFGELEKD